MKTTFPKKSQEHQEIIKKITEIIKEQGKSKVAYIILFGSFARGNWVHDIYTKDKTTYEYASDYDFLVLTKDHNQGSGGQALRLEDKIKEKISRKYLDRWHPSSVIIEPLTVVNKKLRKGNYFFSDIKKEGILLYKSEGVEELKEPKELTNLEKKEMAQEYFDYWFEKGDGFLDSSYSDFNKGKNSLSAFLLHQTTEALYNCIELVFTNYRPKIHNIEILNKRCLVFCKELKDVFPQNTKDEKECFELLKKAYIDARYEKNYSISKEQLEYLIKRVEKLKEITKIACEEKINSF